MASVTVRAPCLSNAVAPLIDALPALAVLDMDAPRDVGVTRGRVADIERAVAPNRVHDHRQLARHGDTGHAVAGAFGDLPAPVLDLVLVLALEARHQTRRRLVERAAHVGIAGPRDAPGNSLSARSSAGRTESSSI